MYSVELAFWNVTPEASQTTFTTVVLYNS